MCRRFPIPAAFRSPLTWIPSMGFCSSIARLFAGTSYSEADADAAEELTNFSLYLEPMPESLASRGIAYVPVDSGRVTVLLDDRPYTWAIGRDGDRIGYLLLRPGRPPEERFGVLTTRDLLRWIDSTGSSEVRAAVKPSACSGDCSAPQLDETLS